MTSIFNQNALAEDRILAALDSWTAEALPEENRIEARKKIEECLYRTPSTLNLRGLQLTSLPDIWDYPVFVEKLETINLSGNTLSKLPDSLNSLQTLKKLILFNSGITNTPANLYSLEKTIKLQLTTLPLKEFSLDSSLTGSSFQIAAKQEDLLERIKKSASGNILLKAIHTGSLSLVKGLVATGLDVNGKTNSFTPLMLASSLGFKQITEVLLEKGADLYAKDKSGMTAIRYATANGKEDVVTCLEEAMKALADSSSFLFEHRLEHKDLINLLKPLYGDRVSEEGICQGFAVMGMQAILSGHLEQFNKRMEDLALFLAQYKISELQEFHGAYEAVIGKLTEEQNLDVLAFLEGIQVCMGGGIDCLHLFSEEKHLMTQQNTDFTKKALSIVGSKEFHEKGALLDIPAFTGVYEKKDLIHYFSSLERVKLQEPIALKLSSRQHTITVGYDPKKNIWILLGTNNLFSRNFTSIEQLVDNMEMEFRGKTECSDGSSFVSAKIFILAREDEEQSLLDKIQTWKNTIKSSSFPLLRRLEHETFINLLKPLYRDKVSEEGICHGFAVMGIQAILSGHIEQFNKRMEDLTLFLARYEIGGLQESDGAYEAVIEKLKEEKNLDILAFLEGIQLCMRGGMDYPHLFSEGKHLISQQNKDFIKKALSIVGSKEFNDKGTLLNIPTFTGIYEKKDLIRYFSSLESVKLQQTIALQLTSRNHSITVGYDPKNNLWILIGANQVFSINFTSIEQLIDNMEMEFGARAECSDGSSAMSTKIFAMAKEQEAQSFLDKIQTWQESTEFTSVHCTLTLTQEKRAVWFYLSAQAGDMNSIDKLLINNVEVNALNSNGFPPLWSAVENDRLDIVQVLLKAGANVNQPTLEEFFPLYKASHLGYLDIVQALLKAGANANQLTYDGISSLYIAAENGHREIVQALLKAGANANQLTYDGISSLYIAAENGHRDVVKALLEFGAEVNTPTAQRFSPLYIAAQNGYLDSVKTLLEAGAEVNQLTFQGFSPLYIAARQGHQEIVQVLLQAHANPHVVGRDRMTPLAVAQYKGYATIVENFT